MGYLKQNNKKASASKIWESDYIQGLKRYYLSSPQTFKMIIRIFKDASELANNSPSIKSDVCFTKLGIMFGHKNLAPTFDADRVWDRVDKAFPDPMGKMQKICMGTLLAWAMADLCEQLDEYWVCAKDPNSGRYDALGNEISVNNYFKSPQTRPNFTHMTQSLCEAWGAKFSQR